MSKRLLIISLIVCFCVLALLLCGIFIPIGRPTMLFVAATSPTLDDDMVWSSDLADLPHDDYLIRNGKLF
jgi:hypothetical protein